jgi:hypothetical protein
MTDEKKTQPQPTYTPPSWFEQNRRHYGALQVTLQELDSQRDSLPPTFNPKVFLQFINGAVNEVNRLTQHNNALTAALMDANKPQANPTAPEDDTQVDVVPV